jgi:hypothetical protein
MAKRLFQIVLVIVAVASIYLTNHQRNTILQSTPDDKVENLTKSDDLEKAYQFQQSNIQITQQGIIEKILRDDNHGSRHQRFIVKVHPNQHLLISHNIDIAPRIDNLSIGEPIFFSGEYEWNNKGGVIHWTHHDPRGRHPDGWLKYRDQKYQ